ncbi:MAG: hypothetical protein GQ527_12155 [Bacteroidales bacterium]|nr:hypothetical protein [Bacteroidales bacterium]
MILLGLSLLIQHCASPGPLSGGDKDEDPHIFLGSDPQKVSRNILPDKVFIEFDEFLVLKELNQNLIISPPLNEDPEIKLRGKKVLIKNHKHLVYDTNTTYTYYFGNAICDLHEENPIQNFEFVFSTGPTLDSLSIRGKVLNSRFLTPEESVFVCLYKKNMNDTIHLDSLPYFVRPYYVSRTNVEGDFQINNIRYDDYLLFAVRDANSNYYFDMPNEEIAFIDSLVMPQEVFDYIPDSIPIDTSNYYLMDSLWENHAFSVVQNPIDLFLFSQDDSIPKLLETKVVENRKIDFYFKFPIRDSINIRVLNDSSLLPWYTEEFSTHRDTLTLWLTRISQDSLEIELKVDTIQADTLYFLVNSTTKEKEEPRGRRSRKKKEEKGQKKEKETIKYQASIKSSLAFYQDIHIKFETPLSYANFDHILLIEDSINVTPEIYFTDSLQRNLLIHYPWEQATKYKLILPQEALQDIFELENDSIVLDFTTTAMENYGNIHLNLQFADSVISPYLVFLVQGTADKEKIVQQHIISSDSLLVLHHIAEGDYLIKCIKDDNNNGYWNSGNYGLNLLPEPVYYYQTPLNVKADWDIEESWTPSSEDRKRPIIEKKKKKK